MRPTGLLSPLVVLLTLSPVATAGDGNRLAYLDEPCDPYYVGLETPKLVTPQWVGEPGVEAVIVLANDDLRDPAQHEDYLRPILERLKKIDGRAPVSLMANQVDPKHPQLQKWLGEGLSLEAHTWDHPCPCLQGGDLAAAKRTFDRSVDLMAAVPKNQAVAFRMPCCDSMSSVSPRFFTEVLNKVTPAGNFLAIDSSVFHLFTADDPKLPRELVLEADGREKFRKYVPTDRVMANLIEDYPYPYVIGGLIWEIPCLMPSDWNAQHLNGVCSPISVRDLKAAVDATVVKQGVFSLCFHTHGWIRNDQVIELIDYAVAKHGKKVKFLTFREVHDRLTKNLLGGHRLRAPDGQDNGVRVLDMNNDGYMDVVVGNPQDQYTRVWYAEGKRWGGRARLFVHPKVVVEQNGKRVDAGIRFYPGKSGNAVSVYLGESPFRCYRDLDGDGVCEEICVDSGGPAVRRVSRDDGRPALFRSILGVEHWELAAFTVPEGTALVDGKGRDAGLRFVDIDEDGRLDVVFSNAQRYSLHLFTSMEDGWSRTVFSGKRGDGSPHEIPPIVRADGTNNGAWFKHRHMWVQNEDTGKKLPHHVWSRHYTQMLDGDH